MTNFNGCIVRNDPKILEDEKIRLGFYSPDFNDNAVA
jgi:hypothetical protein